MNLCMLFWPDHDHRIVQFFAADNFRNSCKVTIGKESDEASCKRDKSQTDKKGLLARSIETSSSNNFTCLQSFKLFLAGLF